MTSGRIREALQVVFEIAGYDHGWISVDLNTTLSSNQYHHAVHAQDSMETEDFVNSGDIT